MSEIDKLEAKCESLSHTETTCPEKDISTLSIQI